MVYGECRFKSFSKRYWENLDEQVRQVVLRGLEEMGYDVADTDLVVDEFQAYLWAGTGAAFMDLELRRIESSLDALRRGFLQGLDRDRLRSLAFIGLARSMDERFAGTGQRVGARIEKISSVMDGS